MKHEPSFASLLVRQSPSMHYGHGWITGSDRTRWNPSRDQSALLNELHTVRPASIARRVMAFLRLI
ncbi:phage filamentation protein Fil family protein [Enterobacter sp. C2]|uniref:phage filamentation protein Fil family protein n=1 Tax=Enterobacter sp. C2 TaxID=2870346 RepID=UPI001CA3E447|nr:phage filamentation protein Fil family protein [Enterobacter sp. C2]